MAEFESERESRDMSGIEKIESQIREEAQQTAEEILAEARKEAEQLEGWALAEAGAEREEILAEAKKEAKRLEDQMESLGSRTRKQALLEAKQQRIQEVLQMAYNRVLQMEEEPYFRLLEQMLSRSVQPGEGVLRFSGRDLERMPDSFRARVREIADEASAGLLIQEEPAPIDGGFLLIYGDIEENCSLGAVFDARKEEFSDRINCVLFG